MHATSPSALYFFHFESIFFVKIFKRMDIKTVSFTVSSKGNTDIIDVTSEIRKRLIETHLQEGNVLVFVNGSTAGVTTIEFEPGLLKDYPAFFRKVVPETANYEHDNTWHDGNGHSHIRAALQGASLTVPFMDNNLMLGTWQQIVVVDFDNRPRKRNIILQFTGIKNEK